MGTEKKRIEYIDLFRGIGIILMVMCHVGVDYRINHIVYGFHMPMFFFASGLFFKADKYENCWECIKKNLRTLILPYIFFCLIQYIAWLVIESENISVLPFFRCFYMNTDSSLYFGKACWFLTAMFFVQVIYDFLAKSIKSQKWITCTVAFLFIGGGTVKNLVDLPLAILPACVGIAFYHLAVIIKGNNRLRALLLEASLKETLIIVVISITLIIMNGDVNMKKSIYSNLLLFLIGATGMTIAGMNILRMIVQKQFVGFLDRAIKLISNIGVTSITYLGLNEMFIKYLSVIIYRVNAPGIILRLINLLCTLGLCFLSDMLIRRTALRRLIGK